MEGSIENKKSIIPDNKRTLRILLEIKYWAT
jgi:hypothetical protein